MKLGGDPCACKNFKEVYEIPQNAGGIQCGDGPELGDPPREYLKENPYLEAELCKEVGVHKAFYPAQDHNKCMNSEPRDLANSWSFKWCFVDPACTKVEESQRVTITVAWRKCEYGEPSFESTPPDELFYRANQQKTDFVTTALMSYQEIADPELGLSATVSKQEMKANGEREVTIHYGNQTWEVSTANPKCMSGCN